MENNNTSNRLERFFRDTNGNLAIWQWPNLPLIGWILFKLLSLVINSSNIRIWSENLSMAFLFTWAYLEITSGSSYFRRALGMLVMIMLIIGYAHRT